jgi:hypothetical protein
MRGWFLGFQVPPNVLQNLKIFVFNPQLWIVPPPVAPNEALKK